MKALYTHIYMKITQLLLSGGAVSKLSASSVPLVVPDPREDPKSRSPNLGPYTTKGHFIGTPYKGIYFLDPPRGSGLLLFRGGR